MIRDALPEDLDQLSNMARRFVEESTLPYTFDMDLTRELLWAAIHSEESILIVDVQEDVICAAVMGYVSRDFCIEYDAYITKFYVEKEFRGIIDTKGLIRAFEERVGEASMIYTSASSGISERIENLFVTLFKNSGYHVLGRIMAKELL